MHLHPSSVDMEKFHKEFIPRNLLPSNYQGDLESVSNMHEAMTKEFANMKAHFEEEQKQAALELNEM